MHGFLDIISKSIEDKLGTLGIYIKQVWCLLSNSFERFNNFHSNIFLT